MPGLALPAAVQRDEVFSWSAAVSRLVYVVEGGMQQPAVVPRPSRGRRSTRIGNEKMSDADDDPSSVRWYDTSRQSTRDTRILLLYLLDS